MQRYFIPRENWYGNEVTITGDDAHHISKVMRNKEGNKIICNHPDGKAASCTIGSIEPGKILAYVQEWLHDWTELPLHIAIAQGLPKGDKFDFVLQKGTELGASAFIPYQAERSIVVWDKKKAAKKVTRFGKIVKEASEQSHRNKIPVIKPMMDIDQLIQESLHYDVCIFPYEEEAKVSTFQSFGKFTANLAKGQRILVCIGPEGGFSEGEAEKLKENGFKSVRLGPRILRTETAALYVLASISYHFEELGCNECQQ